MKSDSNETRQQILDVGYHLVVSRGFVGVGLAQILAQAGVPKGSFYYYFKSKEQFGEALIEEYFHGYLKALDGLLDASAGGSARQRLMAYWQRWLETQAGDCMDQKCLVVKLSAEVSDLSEPMRQALSHGATQVVERIARCIEAGQTDGSICSMPPMEAAQLLYHLWLGASLMNKLHRSDVALHYALQASQLILEQNRLIA